MSFEDELGKIPDDIENIVKGDIKLGKFKIPKIAVAGGVIGLVAFIALRSRNKSGSSPISTGEVGEYVGSNSSGNSSLLGGNSAPQDAQGILDTVLGNDTPTEQLQDSSGRFEGILGVQNTGLTPFGLAPMYKPPVDVEDVLQQDTYNPASDYSNTDYSYEPVSPYQGSNIPYMSSPNVDFSSQYGGTSTSSPIASPSGALSKGIIAKPITGIINKPKTGSTPIQNVVNKPTTSIQNILGTVSKPKTTVVGGGSVKGFGGTPSVTVKVAPSNPIVTTTKPVNVTVNKPTVKPNVVNPPKIVQPPKTAVQPKPTVVNPPKVTVNPPKNNVGSNVIKKIKPTQ